MAGMRFSRLARGFGGRRARHVGHETLELALVGGVGVGMLGIDFLGIDRREQRLIHQLHAVFLAHLQLARNLVRLVGHDELADGLGEHHDFADGAPRALIRALDQDLGDHRDQALRQKALGLLALVGGQRIDDAVDGLGGAGGMQRAEHQVPGLGRRHRHGDGLGIAHFADQDDVRILAHGGAHALGEGGQVRAQLALDHLARSCCGERTRSGLPG